MDNTSPSKQSGNAQRSRLSQERKSERYRAHANAKFQLDLDFILEHAISCFDYELIRRGKRALMDGDLEEFKTVKILILKSEEVNITLDLTEDAPHDPNQADDPVQLHRNNTLVNPRSTTEILLKTERSIEGRCDPVVCTQCSPLPESVVPSIPASSVVVYAGPGSGKTYLESTVKPAYRGNLYDTDHMTADTSVASHSVVFTNRPDIARAHSKHGVVFAFVPFQAHWMKLCLTKCSNANQQWFADLGRTIQGSFVVRRNSFLSSVLRFRIKGERKHPVVPCASKEDFPALER